MSKKKEILENNSVEDLFVRVELELKESERLDVEPYSYWKSVIHEFIKKPSAIISLILLIGIILLSILVPIFSNAELTLPDVPNKWRTPDWEFLFGADRSGHDLFAKVWTGARTSLILAIVVSLINTFVGIVLGTLWGYFKQLDLIMQEIYNFVINIPTLLYYIVLMFVFREIGLNGYLSMVIAMTLTGWVGLARFIRNQIIIITNREYNIASRTLGTPARRIIIFNILPYILTVIITQVSLTIPAVIGTEVSLSYFGIGLPVTQPSLGRIMEAAYTSWVAHPHVLLFPGLVVGLITIVFYLIGLALADALDPKTHR